MVSRSHPRTPLSQAIWNRVDGTGYRHRVCQTPISHPRKWPKHRIYNLFIIKTLLERSDLRTGAPSMSAFLSGARVSGTLELRMVSTALQLPQHPQNKVVEFVEAYVDR
jgi:hypothetical protein